MSVVRCKQDDHHMGEKHAGEQRKLHNTQNREILIECVSEM